MFAKMFMNRKINKPSENSKGLLILGWKMGFEPTTS